MTLLRRAAFAEGLGTALLTMIVVGSGIAAQQRSPGDPGLQLLYNSIATGAGLGALIVAFSPVSGAQFNPIVTLATWVRGVIPRRTALCYIAVQMIGAVAGSMIANVMFEHDVTKFSSTDRSSPELWLSETVASFGLIVLIVAVSRSNSTNSSAAAVAAFVTAAYWFTPSTAFMNPSLTIARSLTDTFAGIAPASVPAFLIAQLIGACLALLALTALLPSLTPPERTLP